MTIDINKRSGGSTELPVAECIDGHMGTWRVRTDFQPVLDEQEKQTGVSFVEKEYPYKPSMQEVKDFIYGVINMQTDEKILAGFVWNNKPVWLSEENQKNFSEAQRVAQMTDGASLPVKFKLGEDENGIPIYHTFTTLKAITQFYTSAVAYINQCLNDGWEEKDAFDFAPYEMILNPATNNE